MITNEKMAINLIFRETLGMKVKERGAGEQMWQKIMTGRMDGNAKYVGPEKYRILMPWQAKLASEMNMVE